MPLSGGSVYMHSLLFFLCESERPGCELGGGPKHCLQCSRVIVGADKEAEGLCANSFMKVFAQP